MSNLKELRENRFKKDIVTIESIMKEIKVHEGHGTESCPEQYSQIFLDILILSEIPKNDIVRYSKYVLGTLECQIKKYAEETNDGE